MRKDGRDTGRVNGSLRDVSPLASLKSAGSSLGAGREVCCLFFSATGLLSIAQIGLCLGLQQLVAVCKTCQPVVHRCAKGGCTDFVRRLI